MKLREGVILTFLLDTPLDFFHTLSRNAWPACFSLVDFFTPPEFLYSFPPGGVELQPEDGSPDSPLRLRPALMEAMLDPSAVYES